MRVGRRGQREPAGAADPRPLRPPHRRGRVPPGLAPADGARASSTSSTRCRGASRSARRPRGARGDVRHDSAQAEAGLGCPITMTFAVVPALRAQPELAAEWEPRLTVDAPTTRALCRPPRRRGALCGMAMTEKQGGSDVRANTTRDAAERRRTGRRVRAHRPQVVLLGADVRPVPRARADRRGRLLLPAAARAARRRAQRVPAPAPEGQARQPLERLERGRVPTAPGRAWSASRAAACRRSSRWSTTRAWTA